MTLNDKQAKKSWSLIDHQMMSHALKLAQKGQYTARPNPVVGCIIEKDGLIAGQGWHKKSGQAHAEVNALMQAGDKARGATCYVTLEPCAHTGKTGPCVDALIAAGVKKVIAAMLDPNPDVSGKGFKRLKDAGIEVELGLLQDEALQLNRGFVSSHVRHRPWVTCKLAMSLDGRTALSDGTSQWITGSLARSDVQKLRARQDAIMTGTGTVLADNPSLNVRVEDTQAELDDWFVEACKLGFSQPARVLLDRMRKVEPTAKIFNDDARVIYFVNKLSQGMTKANVTEMVAPGSLLEILEFLSKQGINNLLIESGHQLAGHFLSQGIVDEIVVYMAPKLMGNKGLGLFNLNVPNMAGVQQLKLKDLRHIGDDIRLIYELDK